MVSDWGNYCAYGFLRIEFRSDGNCGEGIWVENLNQDNCAFKWGVRIGLSLWEMNEVLIKDEINHKKQILENHQQSSYLVGIFYFFICQYSGSLRELLKFFIWDRNTSFTGDTTMPGVNSSRIINDFKACFSYILSKKHTNHPAIFVFTRFLKLVQQLFWCSMTQKGTGKIIFVSRCCHCN